MTAIRPYRPADQPGIPALLEDSAPPIYRWKLNALHGPGRDEPSRWRTKVAAGPDGEVRGAVTLAHHSIHRGQYLLVVHVAPAYPAAGSRPGARRGGSPDAGRAAADDDAVPRV